MGIFDRSPEKKYRKRQEQALQLFEQGEYERARALYEPLVPEASAIWGPDHQLTLLARASLANTYGKDQPEKACSLLEGVVADCERLFDSTEEWTLNPRFDLAAAYGAAGRYGECHALSERLLTDCTQLFGLDHERTATARQLVANSANDLALAGLASVMDLTPSLTGTATAVADWRERLQRCAESVRAAPSERARLVLLMASGGDSNELEWTLEFVRPDRFHVVQTARSGGEAVYDEWLAASTERFINVGIWVNVSASDASQEAIQRSLVADTYLQLIDQHEPASVRDFRDGETAYLIANYDAAPSDLFSAEAPSSVADSRTALWIDVATNQLRKAQGSYRAAWADGTVTKVEFKHGFTSYGDEISIVAPLDAASAVEQRE
jgi:hypothetical protein